MGVVGKMKDESERDYRTISEDNGSNFIEEHYDKEGMPEFYNIWIMDNFISLSICPEEYLAIKQIFAKSKVIMDSDEYVDVKIASKCENDDSYLRLYDCDECNELEGELYISQCQVRINLTHKVLEELEQLFANAKDKCSELDKEQIIPVN